MWSLKRYKNILLSLIPGIVLVAISLAMTHQSSGYLTLMFGATCAVVVIMNFDFRERIWKIKQVRYTTGIQSNIAVAAFGIAFGLMTIAALTPSVSFDRMADIIRQLTGENQEREIANSLGLEARPDAQDIYILDARRVGGLPNSHLIGSGPELSEQVVMVVRLETAPENAEDILTPLYLRSLIYDRYTGRGWFSRGTQVEDYRPGEELPTQNFENGFPIRQQVQFVEDLGGIIHTLGEPISVDQDFQVAWRINDEDTQIYDFFGATATEETYRADLVIQLYAEDKLRSSDQDYPVWIQERYLTLPETVPERVYTLACDPTATEPTPMIVLSHSKNIYGRFLIL